MTKIHANAEKSTSAFSMLIPTTPNNWLAVHHWRSCGRETIQLKTAQGKKTWLIAVNQLTTELQEC